MNKYLAAYHAQKGNAKKRGIEFLLTFKQWVDFWGEDIERLGRGALNLQMQRFGDSGPYAVGNIKKGSPSQNAKTAGAVKRNKAGAAASMRHQEDLDRLMAEDSSDIADESIGSPDLGYQSSIDRRYTFAANF